MYKRLFLRDQKKRVQTRKRPPIFRYLVLGYFLTILLGALALWLPMSSRASGFTPFVDALFTSVSAICVTGLSVVDMGMYWSPIGEFIIMLLVQIGALGFMSFATLVIIFLGKKITLRQKMLIQQEMNNFDMDDLGKITLYIIGFTLLVETVGAIILSTQFIPEFGLGRGIWFSIFHSVTAFCNAGFDLIPYGDSMSPYITNPIILYTFIGLIITGGLGFLVWFDVIGLFRKKRLSFHSKIVLTATFWITVLSTIVIGMVELFNPKTLVDMDFFTAFNNVLFTAVTIRTAGFTSIPFADFAAANSLVILICIFIGGSPGSTAGGIKNTTFAVLLISVWSFIKGRPYIEAFHRRIDNGTFHRAVVIFMLSILAIALSTFILLLTDADWGILKNAFESISAFGTTGISIGNTGTLSIYGKANMMVMMFLGRVGPLTIGLALAENQKTTRIKYPEGKILIG